MREPGDNRLHLWTATLVCLAAFVLYPFGPRWIYDHFDAVIVAHLLAIITIIYCWMARAGPVFRTRAKVFSAAAAGIIAATWLLTGVRPMSLGGECIILFISGGGVEIVSCGNTPQEKRVWGDLVESAPLSGWLLIDHSRDTYYPLNAFFYRAGMPRWGTIVLEDWTLIVSEIEFPLWIPLCLAAGPTLLLVLRDRRRPAHCCAACGYDLTGNESGICPECGTRIASPPIASQNG